LTLAFAARLAEGTLFLKGGIGAIGLLTLAFAAARKSPAVLPTLAGALWNSGFLPEISDLLGDEVVVDFDGDEFFRCAAIAAACKAPDITVELWPDDIRVILGGEILTLEVGSELMCPLRDRALPLGEGEVLGTMFSEFARRRLVSTHFWNESRAPASAKDRSFVAGLKGGRIGLV
jgi:hypothetical protein